MADESLGVLFLCADNTARSVIAEALLNRFGRGRFRAYSAGLEAVSAIDPMTLATLASFGLEVSSIRARSWREFCTAGAPRIDFVISLCEAAAVQVAAAIPGAPTFACWHISDPRRDSDPEARALAFRRAMRELENRIRLFAVLRHPAPVPHEHAPAPA